MAGKRYWSSNPRPAERERQARRTKVLSSKKSSEKAAKANQDISEQAIIKSRLMQLPPEIRNRVWRLTLTGNTIHISSSHASGRDTSTTVNHAICSVPFDSVGSSTISEHGNENVSLTYHTMHEACRESMVAQKLFGRYASRDKRGKEKMGNFTGRLNLSLLQTCRQIHNEASLLPYSDNVFTIAYGKAFVGLERFLQCLALEQARAIKHLVIIIAAEDFHKIGKGTLRCLRNNLKAVHRFDIILEFSNDVSNEVMRHRSLILHRGELAVLRDSIGTAAKVGARNARPSLERDRGTWNLVPAKKLRSWEAQVMQKLAPSERREEAQAQKGSD